MSISENWWQASETKKILPSPWLHTEVIDYMGKLLQPDFEVLEHGSGGSTLWFAEQVKAVVSIESNIEWYYSLEENLPANINLILWPWKQFPNLSPNQFDLLLIDGKPPEARMLYLDKACELVKPGGYVVLDNANRPELENHKFGKEAELVERFDKNVSNTRYLVTEFYRLPENGNGRV
jgi:predicted O-methyltransferase YrrM